MNWYNYVGGDPVNGRDPTGLSCSNGGYCDPNNPEDDGPPINVRANEPISGGGGGGIITISPGGLGVLPDFFGGGGGGGDGMMGEEAMSEDDCQAANSALKDPAVRSAIAEALRRIFAPGQPTGVSENGFFVSKKIFSGLHVSPIMTDGRQTEMSVNLPGTIYSILFNGSYSPFLFIHTHGFGNPLSDTDRNTAANLGIIVAAVNRKGEVSCTMEN